MNELRNSANARLLCGATVRRLSPVVSGGRIASADVVDRDGRSFRVSARIFVLAAGAVENARLLLVSEDDASVAPGNGGDWLGRCFMEHPRDRSLLLHPSDPGLFARAAFYDAHPGPDGTMIGGRIALKSTGSGANRLPNASVTMLPRLRPAERRERRLLREVVGPRVFSGLVRLGLAVEGYRGGYGWSRLPPEAFDAFHLVVNLEQQAHPDNRLVLGSRRDPFGIPRVELHWQWRPDDRAAHERLIARLAADLESSGLGRIAVLEGMLLDPNGHHHAGTTRMSARPDAGVADVDCRVHGTDNLYVTGASVFPVAGYANPVLTIVALVLRLSDHLRARL